MDKTFRGRLITYSQNKEDLILWGYFHKLEDPGLYIDIGANEPVEDSVTKFYYVRGWRGINVEPQMSCYKKLKLDRPRDINVCKGISDKEGVAEITSFANTGISTFNKVVAAGYGETTKSEISKITTTTLNSLYKKYVKKQAVHFLKIDVEGFEEKVINGNSWKINRPWVICIEQTWDSTSWSKILLKNGYIQHIFDGLNGYYVAKEHAGLIADYLVFSNSESIRFNDALTIRRVLPIARAVNKLVSLTKRL